MKSLTLIYCGEDGNAGKALSQQIRSQDESVTTRLCSVEFFEMDPAADRVVIMPDVPEFMAEKIRAAYPANVFANTPVAIEPPPVMEFFKGAVLTPPMQVAQMQANNNALAEVIPIKRPRGRPRKVAV